MMPARARAALAGIVLVAVCACGTSTPAAPAGKQTPTAPGTAGSAGSTASCDSSAWRSAPVSVSHLVAATAMPIVTAIRTAAHPECGYDRLVLDLNGPAPSYDIRFVSQVAADPSGKPIALPGRTFLLITLHPARAHAESGVPTIVRPQQTLGYPVLKGYAVAGDFEGVFTVALGLDGPTSIRAGELPGHLYIDVRA